MTSISVNTTTMLAILGAEAIAVLGMALFLCWAIRAVGLFHAAARGKEFAETVATANDARSDQRPGGSRIGVRAGLRQIWPFRRLPFIASRL